MAAKGGGGGGGGRLENLFFAFSPELKGQLI